jgi:hypothetical protein
VLLLLVIAAFFAPVVADDRADAMGTMCLARAPQTAGEFQAVTDARGLNWGAGDLMSMTDLPDGRRLFLFGDTLYFPVNSDGSSGELKGFGNNSAWVQSGPCFTQLDQPAGNRSWIQPPEQDGTAYWPGSAVVVGNRLHVFVARVILDNIFGTAVGAAVATFELPSLELARISPIPVDPRRIFGAGAVADGGYLYMYASQHPGCVLCFSGDVYVARVPEPLVQVPTAWQYFNGTGWTSDAHAAAPIISEAASNTNVQPWRNGFLMVTKTFNIFGPDVDAWWAPDPTGPWRKLGRLFRTPSPPPSHIPGHEYLNPFTYAPTVLATAVLDNGRALAAYNVGSFEEADAKVDALMGGPRFLGVTLPDPPAAPARPVVSAAVSPWDEAIGVDRLGRVRAAGGGVAYGTSHTQRAVGVARTVTGDGAWVVAEDGGVFSVGDAQFYGSTGGLRLNQPVVGIAATPTGRGYWLVAKDGGVFSFGDAQFHGSTGGLRLNKPILGIGATPTGRGYWLVASDGGVFAFGDAKFFGSTGSLPLPWPVMDLAPTPSGRGYYLVSLDGAVFAFGDARYFGNAPRPLRAAVVGLSVVPGGYQLMDTAGTLHNRGGAHGPTSIGAADVPIIGTS